MCVSPPAAASLTGLNDQVFHRCKILTNKHETPLDLGMSYQVCLIWGLADIG